MHTLYLSDICGREAVLIVVSRGSARNPRQTVSWWTTTSLLLTYRLSIIPRLNTSVNILNETET